MCVKIVKTDNDNYTQKHSRVYWWKVPIEVDIYVWHPMCVNDMNKQINVGLRKTIFMRQ
jgi:hypothetical protein